MSLYNSQIKTRFIDSVYEKANFRTIFEVPADSLFVSDFRLSGVGQFGTATVYNDLTGSLGAIESIQLVDGNVILDQIFDYSLYQGFKNLNEKNNDGIALNNALKNNALGRFASGLDVAANSGVQFQAFNLRNSMDVARNEQKEGWLSLGDTLELLRETEYIPTNLFRNLRVIINWKTAQNLKNNAKDSTGSYTSSSPVLIIDELVDPVAKAQAMKDWQSPVYNSIENERVRQVAVPNVVDTALGKEQAQLTTYLLNGFNNKRVNRMLMVRSPTDSSTWRDGNSANLGPGNQSSFSVYKPVVQVRLNGINKFPSTGLTKKSAITAMLSDTWGNVSMLPGNNLVGFNNKANYYPTPSAEVGKYDYTGWFVQDKVSDFMLTVGRSGVYGDNVFSDQTSGVNPMTLIAENISVTDNLWVKFTDNVTSNLITGDVVTLSGITAGGGDPNKSGAILSMGSRVLSKGTGVGNINPITALTVVGTDLNITFTSADIDAQVTDGMWVKLSGVAAATTPGDIEDANQILQSGTLNISEGSLVGNTNVITGIVVNGNDLEITFTGAPALQVGDTATCSGIAGLTTFGAGGIPNGVSTLVTVVAGAVATLAGLGVGVTVGGASNFDNAIVTKGALNIVKVQLAGTGATIGPATFASATFQDGENDVLSIEDAGTAVTGAGSTFVGSTASVDVDSNQIINQAMDIRVFGEVEKSIVMKSGGLGYNVVYV